jgi:hypothetical protein
MKRDFCLHAIYSMTSFVILLLFPELVNAESIEWVRQLGTTKDDHANGISSDVIGNVYLTGDTGGNLAAPNVDGVNGFLSKYDAAGSVQWTRQFGTNYSFGMAVSADQPGSIYVSGFTGDSLVGSSAGGEDAYLIKYNDVGSRLWTRQLGTTSTDRSYGVSSDTANIYIAGWTTGSLAGQNAGRSDIFVSKYDTGGNFQWSRQLGTSGADECYGVSTDGSGNIIFRRLYGRKSCREQRGFARWVRG